MVTLEGHWPDISTDQEWLEVAGHRGSSGLSVILVYMSTGTLSVWLLHGNIEPVCMGGTCMPTICLGKS